MEAVLKAALGTFAPTPSTAETEPRSVSKRSRRDTNEFNTIGPWYRVARASQRWHINRPARQD